MSAPAVRRPSPTAAEEHDSDWEGVRLHVVTGKGGTGKTTVAAALALALATDGRRVLLVEVEGRQGLAQLFDVPQLPTRRKGWRWRRTAARCSAWRSNPRPPC